MTGNVAGTFKSRKSEIRQDCLVADAGAMRLLAARL